MEEGMFNGVYAPGWVFNDSLTIALRVLAEEQVSDRNTALLRTAADRIESLSLQLNCFH